MELKKEKNQYGYWKVICPFCSEKVNSKDRQWERGLQTHILFRAKTEAFHVSVDELKESPHLDYLKKHSTQVPIKKIGKRVFDDDIKIV